MLLDGIFSGNDRQLGDINLKYSDIYPGSDISILRNQRIADSFTTAQSTQQPRRDPMVFDLDGDGIETTGINAANPILFDHDADGIKTATGWVKADDAFLVLDRNGNGLIDNGRELFGDATPLAAGGLAADGFAALAQEDTNHDGLVSALDSRYAQLRLWRDLNQDGISQSDELITLAGASIQSITVASTDHSQTLANGNQLADLGHYTKSDGSQGALGEVTADLADINLAQDTFHSEFTDAIPLTATAETLPDMQGSGQVRSLREAASLGTAAANTLAGLLQQFQQATTAQAQRDLLDPILIAWGKTSDLAASGTAGAYNGLPTAINIAGTAAGTPAYNTWLDKLQTLERFNGRTFATPATGAASVTVNLFQQRLDVLGQSWQALEESVYGSLVLQTRLKPYLDAISLSVTDAGIAMDFSGMEAALSQKMASDGYNALTDIVDIQKYGGEFLNSEWRPYEFMGEALGSTTITPEMSSFLSAQHIVSIGASGLNYGVSTSQSTTVLGNALNNVLSGNGGADVLYGLAGNDTLNGGSGADVLNGGDGDDVLNGGNEGDTLAGGAGNDILNGGSDSYSGGSDTYLFDLGGGVNTINESSDYSNATDVLRFGAGINPGDISVVRNGNNLEFRHLNGTDKVIVANWFISANTSAYKLDRVDFANGTQWAQAALTAQALVLTGTAGADTLNGIDTYGDTLNGLAGNDTLNGGSGADVLNGGDGDDVLNGGNEGDTLAGGAGNDILNGGSDSYSGGSDTYLFDLGGGVNTINESSDYSNATDVLRFGAGINPGDISVVRNGNDLEFRHLNGTDKVIVANWFISANTSAYKLDRVNFANGTQWAQAALTAQALVLTGTAGADTLNGIDTYGDTLNGLAGNDTLNGGSGADVLNGGDGDDVLNGGNEGDTLAGGAGNDILNGGSDSYSGGSDTYLFDLGGGVNTINESSDYSNATDVLRFGAGINPGDISVVRNGNDLEFRHLNGTDKVIVANWFISANTSAYKLDRVDFANGTQWTQAALTAQALVLTGTAGADTLNGIDTYGDTLNGLAGNDTLNGGSGADVLNGGDGDDVLNGGNEGDTLAGGAGNDILNGGSDSY